MKCPVLSRWEHVGEASNHLELNYDEWLIVCQYIIDMNKADTNANTIASYLYSYLNEDMLYSQLLL